MEKEIQNLYLDWRTWEGTAVPRGGHGLSSHPGSILGQGQPEHSFPHPSHTPTWPSAGGRYKEIHADVTKHRQPGPAELQPLGFTRSPFPDTVIMLGHWAQHWVLIWLNNVIHIYYKYLSRAFCFNYWNILLAQKAIISFNYILNLRKILKSSQAASFF